MTETQFLAARATAHAESRGVDLATHRAHCDCSRRPTFCARCDRDLESPDSLAFTGSTWICLDCIDATHSDNFAA